MSKYNVSYTNLGYSLLPLCLRKDTIKAFVKVLLSPFENLDYDFQNFIDEKNIRLSRNGQVCYLRKTLNSNFTRHGKGITITDSSSFSNATMLYAREKSEFTILEYEGDETILNRRGYGGSNSVNFVVNIPTASIDLYGENKIKSLINEYKLASMRYTIKSI